MNYLQIKNLEPQTYPIEVDLSARYTASFNNGLYMISKHYFAIASKKDTLLTQNGAKMKRFDPDSQLNEVRTTRIFFIYNKNLKKVV